MKLTNATKSDLYLYLTLEGEWYNIYYVKRKDGEETLYLRIGDGVYELDDYNEESQDYLLSLARGKIKEAELRTLFDKSRKAQDAFLTTENKHHRNQMIKNRQLFFRPIAIHETGGNLI